MSDAIYTTANCAGCIIVKQALARAGLAVPVFDIDANPAARNAYAQLGVRHVPAARIGGQVVVGPQEILAALRMRYGRP